MSGRLIIILSLLVIFCCNKDSFDSVIKNAKDTKKVDSIKIKKPVDSVEIEQNNNFRQYPKGKKFQISFEHEIWLERDTFLVKHYHMSGNKVYVILLDGRELFCDDVREIIE